ncbi:PREDICTED: protein PET100 homolog, mitochondrial-like [Branchiostoma belcheri]|uniref:Protein PET100 homolog, mitochondrial-like n=1 Tax=Branchiostoma belcheri TaxID=7741 RepID=A0A6P4XZK0_BRABE|nr:PREDICTED: protein PET100 homolog, mitochondrial-like [Branchiostoma belcheri]
MGDWRLEVFRLSVHDVFFPVGIFWYFNQPDYFEEHVKKRREERLKLYSNPEYRREVEEFAERMRKRQAERNEKG